MGCRHLCNYNTYIIISPVKQLPIPPQDPTIFSGTLRANLDPFSRHDDAALWDALERVQLREAVAAMGGLSATVAECGDNFSGEW